MTISEFKAWLDGFCEAIGDNPTPEQWAKIKDKLDGVRALPFPAKPTPIFHTQYPDTWVAPRDTSAGDPTQWSPRIIADGVSRMTASA